jgi:hypothetical protein
VIVPAARRAGAVWAGAAIVGAILFGPTGLRPHDLTSMALHVPGVGAVLAATWILLFVPAARVIVRADGASYLRALPGPRALPHVIAALALVALQMPWLALWLAGDGARGAAIVVALTVPIVAIAAWRPRPPRAKWPAWRGASRALAGVYARALRRRAGDAIVRGVGLAVLAGLAGALLASNNQLEGWHAATLATGAIVIVLVPGWAGLLLPLADVHRASAWLVATLGISEAARVAVLALVIALVYVAGAAIAVSAAAVVLGDAATIAWLAATALGAAAGTGLVATRLLLWADRSQVARAVRVAVGAVLASAACVLVLGLLGVTAGVALVAAGVLAIATVKP